jgi:SNF2 family DNA or RNA helicase
MGLNLQSGGCTDICWFSITFDAELYEQAIARVWRQGVSGSVTVHHIVASQTIDEHILKVLQAKQNVQQALLDYLTK